MRRKIYLHPEINSPELRIFHELLAHCLRHDFHSGFFIYTKCYLHGVCYKTRYRTKKPRQKCYYLRVFGFARKHISRNGHILCRNGTKRSISRNFKRRKYFRRYFNKANDVTRRVISDKFHIRMDALGK